ncbi:TetR/AcrR family transcriptional regulator [Acetobacterium sp.]|uniref:TetR/AcrR family transcriptional regulator n=1 Tax=Acetobacterium sp. TaxID=1872094 RepID=UPI00359387D9
MKAKNKKYTSKKCTQLIETAKDLFFKHGVKRITIGEICNESNVSKVTFYQYFSNKDELVRHIRNELIENGFSKFDEINELDIGFPEKVELITQWRINFLANLKSDFIEDILSVEDTIEEMKSRYLKNIEAAQTKGEVRTDLSPELIWLVTEKLNELVRDGSWKEIFSDYSEFQKQLRKMYFYGLLDYVQKP